MLNFLKIYNFKPSCERYFIQMGPDELTDKQIQRAFETHHMFKAHSIYQEYNNWLKVYLCLWDQFNPKKP